MRKAKVKIFDQVAGYLIEDENDFTFTYADEYLNSDSAVAISLTLPLRKELFRSKVLFPFFDGLIPEGWLLDIAEKNWKLNPRDRMGLLLACCKDCIGAVSVFEISEKQVKL
jgi:serine/threonine-protein kinase HipA